MESRKGQPAQAPAPMEEHTVWNPELGRLIQMIKDSREKSEKALDVLGKFTSSGADPLMTPKRALEPLAEFSKLQKQCSTELETHFKDYNAALKVPGLEQEPFEAEMMISGCIKMALEVAVHESGDVSLLVQYLQKAVADEDSRSDWLSSMENADLARRVDRDLYHIFSSLVKNIENIEHITASVRSHQTRLRKSGPHAK